MIFTGKLAAFSDRERTDESAERASLIAELRRLAPHFDPSGRSNDYLRGRIEYLAPKRLDADELATGSAVSQARQRMIERQSTAWMGESEDDDDQRLDDQREDELPSGGHTEPSKIETPKPRDYEEERAALEAKLRNENRPSAYIDMALRTFDQTVEIENKVLAEKHGRRAAKDHVQATQDYHEQNRTDGVNENPVARARRENEERLRSAWQTPPASDE